VTDGKPNCPAVGDKGASDETATYAALDALRAANIKTYVVGYLTQNMALVMDEMARRGGTEKHYAVSNANDIVKAIGLVTSSVAPCSFTLSKTPAGPQYVQVTVDGADVPLDPVQGWSLQNSTTVAFNGKACEALRDGKDHPIRIAVTCEPVKPR
jgi:hypothetical protein